MNSSRHTPVAEQPPTDVLGVCDDCGSMKWFTSQHDHDLWLHHHPHNEGLS